MKGGGKKVKIRARSVPGNGIITRDVVYIGGGIREKVGGKRSIMDDEWVYNKCGDIINSGVGGSGIKGIRCKCRIMEMGRRVR